MKWTPVRVGLAAVVVVAGLYGWDAVMPRKGELVPFPQRVSFEEYMSRQLPELSRMAGQVAAEMGGELTVMGLPYVQACGIDDTQGYRVVGYSTVAPQISFDRLEEVVRAHRRDGTSGLWVQNDFRNDGSRRIYFTDNDGNSAEFKYTETGIEMSSYSSCLPTSHALNDPGQFVLPSVDEAFPGVRVTVSDNTNPDLHPLPTLTLGAQADPQPDAQSGAQSGS
ncbi:DUF4853 domain-containing protein [Schaalia odontolytica]|uniref:DUF4853 domain-containing protein n=1 Tax=Schaalia odontolytica TaxID=1660 RepID=UPI002109735B|nr:DUF4853 domain-containing protein [Schaalia odontolytica]MCQ5271842.1 DUF4853 domain-containing protein [Schaalia odontolytica]MCQ5281179.1 DUF4853 domain-containing protein [Schaalia odontolytica]